VTTPFAYAQDLFTLKSQYLEARSQYRNTTGKESKLIKDLAARRFINLPDWIKHLESSEVVDPRVVYRPSPETWDKWQKTAFGALEEAIQNKTPLSIKLIKSWHGQALSGKLSGGIRAGSFKINDNYGSNVKTAWALEPQEVDNIRNFVFSDNKTSLKWTQLICQEDLQLEDGDLSSQYNLQKDNRECRKIYRRSKWFGWANHYLKEAKESIKNNDLFNSDGTKKWFWFACWPRYKQSNSFFEASTLQGRGESGKQCGMVHYPKSQKATKILERMFSKVNDYFTNREELLKKARVTPEFQRTMIKADIQLAISIQREFTALHPFKDGNGRISRYLMDYITFRTDLPTLFIPNMNNDYSASFEDYFLWATKSIEETTQIIQSCTQLFKKKSESQKTKCGLISLD